MKPMVTKRWAARCGRGLRACLLCAAAALPAGQALAAYDQLYLTVPDVSSCSGGRIQAEEGRRVLEVVNEIRRLHGLGEVGWDPQAEEATQQAALMLALNRRLSHTPSADWVCHSPVGVQGAATSNLHLSVAAGEFAPRSSADMVVGFLTDVRNRHVGDVGHRRWLLDPFLKRVAFGRVGLVLDGGVQVDAAALSVVSPLDSPAPPSRGQIQADHLAWPVGNYPQKYFHPDAYLSFSAVVDPYDRAANLSVDYRETQVTLRRPDGQILPVSQVSFDLQPVGLPNHLQFKAEGIEPDVEYEAVIQGVRVEGVARDYRYRFRITP
jgi:hypothetical protein